MRERSGLEQQLLVNGSEIRRLELNRNATEKHLEQERREEGKEQSGAKKESYWIFLKFPKFQKYLHGQESHLPY